MEGARVEPKTTHLEGEQSTDWVIIPSIYFEKSIFNETLMIPKIHFNDINKLILKISAQQLKRQKKLFSFIPADWESQKFPKLISS